MSIMVTFSGNKLLDIASEQGVFAKSGIGTKKDPCCPTETGVNVNVKLNVNTAVSFGIYRSNQKVKKCSHTVP